MISATTLQAVNTRAATCIKSAGKFRSLLSSCVRLTPPFGSERSESHHRATFSPRKTTPKNSVSEMDSSRCSVWNLEETYNVWSLSHEKKLWWIRRSALVWAALFRRGIHQKSAERERLQRITRQKWMGRCRACTAGDKTELSCVTHLRIWATI